MKGRELMKALEAEATEARRVQIDQEKRLAEAEERIRGLTKLVHFELPRLSRLANNLEARVERLEDNPDEFDRELIREQHQPTQPYMAQPVFKCENCDRETVTGLCGCPSAAPKRVGTAMVDFGTKRFSIG